MNFNSFIVFILLGIIVFPTNLVAQKRGGKNRSIVLNDKGSKLSILSKVVNEKKHPLPYTPIEVCKNFSVINSTIDNLDWRSTWSGNTRIRESMVNLARLIRSFPESAQVIYFTDGEEAPKLHVFNTRDLSQFQGGNDWLLVGVGSAKGTPIPKYDSKNQLIGYWSNESFALQPGIAQISQSNIGTRSNKIAFSESDRYLSKLDEKYLIDLSNEIKGNYVRGDNIDNILAAMEKQKPLSE